MKPRSFNWSLWVGFLLSLTAFLSYFFVFRPAGTLLLLKLSLSHLMC